MTELGHQANPSQDADQPTPPIDTASSSSPPASSAVGFEQVTETKNGALVGQVVLTGIQTHELTEQRHVVQRFFHRWVREVEPLLQEVDTQHRLDGKRWSSALGARGRCMRRDQRHQLGPGHHQVHLVQELALARPLGLALESALAQAQLFHAVTVSHRAMGAEVVQTFPRKRASSCSSGENLPHLLKAQSVQIGEPPETPGDSQWPETVASNQDHATAVSEVFLTREAPSRRISL